MEKLTLLQKLHKIQCEVTNLHKDEKGMNYHYVSGSQVLSAVKPLMNELGLLLIPEVKEVDCHRVDYLVGKDSRQKSEMFTKTKQLFTWVDINSGEKLSVEWAANGQNDWDKGLGSALTYGERYFLLKFFHIATDEDDPDGNQTPTNQQAKPIVQKDNRPTINALQLAAVIKRVKEGDFEAKENAKKAFKFTEDQLKQLEDGTR